MEITSERHSLAGWYLFAGALTLFLPMAGATKPLEWWPVLSLPVGILVGVASGRLFWWLRDKLACRPFIAWLLRIAVGSAVVAALLSFRWYGTEPFGI